MTAGTCVTCQFVIPTTGECHRFPPTLVFQGSTAFSVWPTVSDGDWCGEYQGGSAAELSLTSLTPNTLAAGTTPATIDVIGVGFDNTCSVYLNGSPRATFYIDTTHLQYTARPDLATSGDVDQVTVANATNTSNALPFTFT